MTKPERVPCPDPKVMRAHFRNSGLTKHTHSSLATVARRFSGPRRAPRTACEVPYPPGCGIAPDFRSSYQRLCGCRYARGPETSSPAPLLTCGDTGPVASHGARSHPEKYHKLRLLLLYPQVIFHQLLNYTRICGTFFWLFPRPRSTCTRIAAGQGPCSMVKYGIVRAAASKYGWEPRRSPMVPHSCRSSHSSRSSHDSAID